MSESTHRDEIRAEYALLQGQYESFDARALTIKSLATPLLAGGIGVGLKESSASLIAATAFAAACLWLLEAIWKSFQYCFADRIKLIEGWFRGEHVGELAPFQIFTAWNSVWHKQYSKPASLLPILRQPFVYLPYLPIVLVASAAIALMRLLSMPR